MPDGYGSEVLKTIRKVKPEIPVIMTGHSGENPTLKTMRDVDYMRKPFQLANLKKRVAEMLSG